VEEVFASAAGHGPSWKNTLDPSDLEIPEGSPGFTTKAARFLRDPSEIHNLNTKPFSTHQFESDTCKTM
jgi:hypothetical protein